ncbi:hypothetical protein PEC18_34085 [Paucibacter sp. O1-1]|nr:hypothetical protein [Paucibacter sp. O1-1]MDA3830722.1 hypothetical protein [Paucibacter sp. O1-1]
MKTIKKIVTTAMVITLWWIVVEVQAQDKKVDPALRNELKAYTLTHIMPVMKLKRVILEDELTELEKETDRRAENTINPDTQGKKGVKPDAVGKNGWKRIGRKSNSNDAIRTKTDPENHAGSVFYC